MIVKVPEKKVEIQKQNWLLMHTVELHYNRIISCETQMTDHVQYWMFKMWIALSDGHILGKQIALSTGYWFFHWYLNTIQLLNNWGQMVKLIMD